MLDRLSRLIRRKTSRFASDREGSVMPVFTLALVPVLAMVGSAVDYSRASNLRFGLQSALDVAILAGARDGTSNSQGLDLEAVSHNGNHRIISRDNCFVGGVSKVGKATLTPTPDPKCKPVADPFKNYSKPTVGACDYTNYSASGHNTVTLQPGVYCGGMSFSGQDSAIFAPGLYVNKDGVLHESGGSQLTGHSVTFFII